ncbi:MAG: hypothetical protein MJZ60_07410 [Bacteroidaceae bacterium]|nr:hypothetical protein [Bacteroidaceae bacterium]
MKKYISFAAIAAFAALTLTSCDDKDEAPELKEVTTSEGVFVINSGNQSGKIDGSLTYYDYNTKTATQNVYQAANGKSLGLTLPGCVVYGSKIYIVGSVENTVFIADRKTLKEVATLKTEVDGVGVKGRDVCAGNGYVYVASYANTVFAIDTLTNTITKTFKSGDYSDGICFYKDCVYTGDTDYGKYGKAEHGTPSVTKINVATGQSTIITNDAFRNPTDLVVVDGRLFMQDKGYYGGEGGSQIDQNLFEIDADGKILNTICAASTIAASNDKIYIIDAPYKGHAPEYKVYDVKSGKLSTFCAGNEILYPNMISVDPVKNIVFITSYQLKAGTTSADYKVAGYVAMYDGNTGAFLGQFECGVGGGAVIANTKTEMVQK